MLAVHPQFVNVFAVWKPDRGVCWLIGCTVFEPPIALPAPAAAGIENVVVLPILRLQRCRRPAKLLLMLRQYFSIDIPLAAETVGRTIEVIACSLGRSIARLSSGGEYNRIGW
jgi:hypothetical protein